MVSKRESCIGQKLTVAGILPSFSRCHGGKDAGSGLPCGFQSVVAVLSVDGFALAFRLADVANPTRCPWSSTFLEAGPVEFPAATAWVAFGVAGWWRQLSDLLIGTHFGL
jgi:hypothetical protein